MVTVANPAVVGTEELVRAEDFYRRRLLDIVDSETEWLDLGCGRMLLRWWLPNGDRDQQELSRRCRRLVGVDAVAEDVRANPYLHEAYVADCHRLPFADGSFNLLTAQMVVEHIEHPEQFLAECTRLLKPGGRLLFITPNLLHYQIFLASLIPDAIKRPLTSWLEGRAEHDIFKTYYRMNTPSRVRKLAESTGFRVERLDVVECWPEFQKIKPLLLVEKLILQVLRWKAFENLRADIICSLVKPP